MYEDLLPKKLRHDIMNYYADKDYKPKTPLLPPRTGQACVPPPKTGQGYDIDSVVINNKQAEWISSKIVESTKQLQEDPKTSMKQDDGYKLTLLYRKSRDGNRVAKFRKLCNGKGPTIAVGKVLDTEEILGGYNPFSWGTHNGWVKAKKSFIFALDKLMDKCIVSFVVDCAIYDHNVRFPDFGSGLYFGNKTASPRAKKSTTYKFSIRSSSDEFEWADWEVFLVSKP